LFKKIAECGGRVCSSCLRAIPDGSIDDPEWDCNCLTKPVFGVFPQPLDAEPIDKLCFPIPYVNTSERSFSGNERVGCSAVRLTSERNLNCVSQLNHQINPTVTVVGVGGRKKNKEGKWNRTHDQSITTNLLLYKSEQIHMPFRLLVQNPKTSLYNVQGLWEIIKSESERVTASDDIPTDLTQKTFLVYLFRCTPVIIRKWQPGEYEQVASELELFKKSA